MQFVFLARWQHQIFGLTRIVAGALFLSHGLVKLFSFPAGVEPGQQALLSLMGIGGVIELITGFAIMLGWQTRLAAFVASGQMAVAYWMFHAPGSLFPVANGGDAAILYCFIFLYVAAAGPGAFSLDRQAGDEKESRIYDDRSYKKTP